MRRRYLRNRARGNIIYPGLIAAWSAKVNLMMMKIGQLLKI